MQVAIEPWTDCRAEIVAMWPNLAQEADQTQDGLTGDGDVELYDRIFDRLIVMTARENGLLVGFWIAFLMPHQHYRGKLALVSDLFYSLPSHRKMPLRRMVRLMLAEAKAKGAAVAYINSPIGRDFGPLLQPFGFRPTEQQHRAFL